MIERMLLKGKYVKRRPHVSNRAMNLVWFASANNNPKGRRIK